MEALGLAIGYKAEMSMGALLGLALDRHVPDVSPGNLNLGQRRRSPQKSKPRAPRHFFAQRL
jgi:hypothetical protein